MVELGPLWATVCLSKDVGKELERIGERDHRRKGETKRGNKKEETKRRRTHTEPLSIDPPPFPGIFSRACRDTNGPLKMASMQTDSLHALE